MKINERSFDLFNLRWYKHFFYLGFLDIDIAYTRMGNAPLVGISWGWNHEAIYFYFFYHEFLIWRKKRK